MFRPVVPCTLVAALAKLVVLNQGLPTLIPPRTLMGAIWSRVALPPLPRFRLLLPVNESGLPVRKVKMPESCQPPRILLPIPCDANGLPLPNVSSGRELRNGRRAG